MPLQLEIVSEHREILDYDHLRVFSEDGDTIGRSLQNDWILPNPDRFISGQHATIDFQSDTYNLADVSSNGVYVTDEIEPLGRSNPRRLFHNDRLRRGDFEFHITLDEGKGLYIPPQELMTVVPNHIEQLFDEDSLKSDIQPNSLAPALMKEQQTNTNATELLDSFMQGLGIARADMHPSTDPHEILENAGRVLSEFVDGISELLASRSTMKSMFRLNQTTVLPRHKTLFYIQVS